VSRVGSRTGRIAAVALGIAIGGLAAEGAVSLLLGRSLLRLGAERALPTFRLRALDEERIAAAARAEGCFAVDVDPWVSTRMKSRFEAKFLDGVAHTDDAGRRVRVGPPEEPGARRLVILGDSVAFGFGLNDDQTIAHATEAALAQAAEGKAPRPVALTVACPGWSFRNAYRALLDQQPGLRADLVYAFPVDNDLDDSFALLETGYRATDFDPAAGASRAHIAGNHYFLLLSTQQRRFPAIEFRHSVLVTGVTRESKRRYAELARECRELHQRLAETGGRFAVAVLNDGVFQRRMLRALAETAPEVPVVGLFDESREVDQLSGDPHPNRAFARAIGWRVAEHALRQGWLPGVSADRLAPEDPAYAKRHFEIPGRDDLLREQAKIDRIAVEQIGPRIDFDDGTGWHQVYGGIAPDGTIGMNAAVVVGGAGGRLECAFDRLADAPSLYPLDLTFTFDGEAAAPVSVPAATGQGPVRFSVDVPAALRGNELLDVEIHASNWIARAVEGTTGLASIRLRSIARTER